MSEVDLWRETARALDREAKNASHAAKRWKRLALLADAGAKDAKKWKLEDSETHFRERADALRKKAKEFEERAKQRREEAAHYREKLREHEKLRKLAEKEICRSRARRAELAEARLMRELREKEKATSTPKPTPSKYVCGPDITENVFATLDQIHKDWNTWPSSTRAERCRDLLNPLVGGRAWDIGYLDPSISPLGPKMFWVKQKAGSAGLDKFKDHDDYLKNGKFWFEAVSNQCAIPRHYPCGPTVRFLGQCIHAQVVNYIQWGTLSQLCKHYSSADLVNWMWRKRNGTPENIYKGQRLMEFMGRFYTNETKQGHLFAPKMDADPGTNSELERPKIRKKLARQLRELMATKRFAAFGKRAESVCTEVCKLTPQEADRFRKVKFGYRWGAHSTR